MSMSSPSRIRWSAALFFAVVTAGCGPRYSHEEIASAVEQLRELYDLRDYEQGMIEGERWRNAGRRASEPRAWYVRHLAWYGSPDSAVSSAEQMVQSRPTLGWGWWAFAAALNRHRERGKEAVAASDSAMRLLPNDPYVLALRAEVLEKQDSPAAALAYIDSLAPELRGHPLVLSRRGAALALQSYWARDPSLRDSAYAVFAEARAADSTLVEAYYQPASYLYRDRRNDEALALLSAATELTSASQVHEMYWRATLSRRDLSPEEKRDRITHAAESLLTERGELVQTLRDVAEIYAALNLDDEQRRIEERLLDFYPHSIQVEWTLMERARTLSSKAYEGYAETQQIDSAALQQARLTYEALIDRPVHHDKGLLGMAYLWMFRITRRDSTVSAEAFYGIVRGMVEFERLNPHITYADGAIWLANRKTHFREAERIAREGVVEAKKRVDENNRRGSYDTEGEYQQAQDYYNSLMTDALGWVYFNEGRLDEAEQKLLEAHDFNPRNVGNLHHLGQLYEQRYEIAADGDTPEARQAAHDYVTKAEDHYMKGALVQEPGTNPNDSALAGLYEKRHGTLDGFDDYRASIEDIDRMRRHEKILADRLDKPRSYPPFTLATLRGDTVRSQVLAGKIVVINFWGMWCGPCVFEMPEYQKFHERYRGDPEVVVLTINNDPNADDLRAWMKGKAYTFRNLLDDGYVDRDANINAFPTTWFIGRDGLLHFVKEGWSESLAEEFSWRTEALRTGTP